MGKLLAVAEGMRTLGLLISLLVAAPQSATDQKPAVPDGTIIMSAQVTGFDIDRLSPGLREEIRNLVGTPLKQEGLAALAARIEAERPRRLAAVRTVMDPGGQAQVTFIVSPRDESDRDDNVNERYIVEQADISGVPETELTQELRDDLRAVVGQRLDSPEAERLRERIERDLPRYDMTRRIQRGSEVGRIRLVYEARRKEPPSWLRFDPDRSNALYHSEQGWGSHLNLTFGDSSIRFTPIIAIDVGDDLVEEYSGWGLRFESRKLGTRLLGVSLEWTRFEQDWRAATLSALEAETGIPPLYETRSTFTPMLKFAFTPSLSVAAGVSISELELSPDTGSQMANAAVASIDFDGRWKDGAAANHRVEARFGVRAGARQLESDLAYTRYLGQGAYQFDFGRHHVQATGMAGGITGRPPLFERFTLGDSTTLRGWDKYDIAPAGADRMFHSSVEYR
jgi:hypothetical protein